MLIYRYQTPHTDETSGKERVIKKNTLLTPVEPRPAKLHRCKVCGYQEPEADLCLQCLAYTMVPVR